MLVTPSQGSWRPLCKSPAKAPWDGHWQHCQRPPGLSATKCGTRWPLGAFVRRQRGRAAASWRCRRRRRNMRRVLQCAESRTKMDDRHGLAILSCPDPLPPPTREERTGFINLAAFVVSLKVLALYTIVLKLRAHRRRARGQCDHESTCFNGASEQTTTSELHLISDA